MIIIKLYVERLFTGRIEDEAILCTDSHKSYIQFAQNLGIELQHIKRGKHKEGIYHIQHINAFHSKLKKWMERFNGVATKYISNYIKWFKWLHVFDTEKEMVKTKNFIIQSNVTHSYIRVKDLKNREPLYV